MAINGLNEDTRVRGFGTDMKLFSKYKKFGVVVLLSHKYIYSCILNSEQRVEMRQLVSHT